MKDTRTVNADKETLADSQKYQNQNLRNYKTKKIEEKRLKLALDLRKF